MFSLTYASSNLAIERRTREVRTFSGSVNRGSRLQGINVANTSRFKRSLHLKHLSIKQHSPCTQSLRGHASSLVRIVASASSPHHDQYAPTSQDLLELVNTTPDDVASIRTTCDIVSSKYSGQNLDHLYGDWKVVWSDLPAIDVVNDLPSATSLRMLSFGSLPDVPACVKMSLNRVDAASSSYILVHVIELPWSTEDDETSVMRGAVVLTGKCNPSESPDTPNRLSVQFESMKTRVVPNSSMRIGDFDKALIDAGFIESDGMHGVGTITNEIRRDEDSFFFMCTSAIQVKPTYIDVEFMDDVLRLHRGQSETRYVLCRLPDDSIEDMLPGTKWKMI